MKKATALGMLICLASSSYANSENLGGFTYGKQDAPTGKEWENPQHVAHNKEQPRATFYDFATIKNARKVLPDSSRYWQSLDGKWKFNWVRHPDLRPKDFFKPSFDVSKWDDISVPSSWNLAGLQKDGKQKYGTPIYCNQPVIFKHRVTPGDWKGGVMRTPPTDWVTYKDRNEVGSHRRTFTISKDWDGREVFVKFNGVDSFFYLWINGSYIGFSKNSRNAAIFNITEYVKKGDNVIAAEVYRNSDGSFIEAQDMFRLPGIFRSVELYSTPKVHLRDLFVLTDLEKNYQDATLSIKATLSNLGGKDAKDYKLVYSLYANELYSDDNSKTSTVGKSAEFAVLANQKSDITTAIQVKNPNKWSAERPYRYTLVAELKNKANETVEVASLYFGFKEVEIKDTLAKDDEFGLAGRYYYVNGKTVKLKGVNRHETCPATGHVLTRAQMKEEVMIMKRGNINHVRNSHYPPNTYWYYLCDKYGIYLEDEANIESHEYYYGSASLSHPPEWKDAHVARVVEMTHQNKNHPSIVIWSLGNEAGPGQNFVHAYNALKKIDTSRPVQYERNNSIVDMGSNQYPSIGWMRNAVQGKMGIKYPFHISEYAHSMGNACGNLIDYWDAIESTNFFCGGAIWDWVDQAVYNYTADGTRYLAYGGDFGDKPNSGQFVMNGIIFAERDPKPQYYEVKKVYQYIGIKATDLANGKYEIFNKNYFVTLEDYQIVCSLYKDGKKIDSKKITMPKVAPRAKATIQLPYSSAKLDKTSEYFVKLQLTLAQDKPWASKGYAQAEEQFLLKKAKEFPAIADVAKKISDHGAVIVLDQSKTIKVVSGEGFRAKFDMSNGSLYGLIYDGKTIIADGNGPKLDAFRAFVNNDTWGYKSWFDHGLHNLKHTAVSAKIKESGNDSVTLSFTVISQAANAARINGGTSSGQNSVTEMENRIFSENDFRFVTNQIWTVYADGSIELQSSIAANEANFVLPRLGYIMTIPAEFSTFSYYGRGPQGNYNDRETGAFIEYYQGSVADQVANFPKPQDMANHEDTRWCALTKKKFAGKQTGAIFIATKKLSVNALPYKAMDMVIAGHKYQLPAAGDTLLRLDVGVTGLGGNSCGQGGPLGEDRIYAGQNDIGFIIRPAGKNLSEIAKVSQSGQVPISITRARNGAVTVASTKKDAKLYYSINGGATKAYSHSIPLIKGGKVSAWYKGDKESEVSITYKKIDKIQTIVSFVSSQEPGGGNAASNLVDGNPNTMWHTMYSVTVAQYPHWVEFDSGEVKTIKGCSYTPRQGGNNGDVKKYTIHVSLDGKKWGKPIHKGKFKRSKKEQRIIFSKPVKARFVRFTAISSQNGQDFASGAEFSLFAK